MSRFFYKPTVGIDVSEDFSMVVILAPNGDIYRKAFKIYHDVDGFNHLIKEIKKVEKEFNMKTGIFMESTSVYHLSLFHFLKTKNLEAYVINPLVTNSIKNNNIRKVKNDKKDVLTIAKIGKFQNIKAYIYFDVPIFTLKSLCSDYYKLVDIRSTFKKKISKRSTRLGRRALYAVALASIRTKRTGESNNKILLGYYKDNLNVKKKNVALVAIMHKLVKYIFAVLRNQKEYEQRLPKPHHKMYLENTNNLVA